MDASKLDGLPRPAVQLSGDDGNAFLVVGRTAKALLRAGWTREQVAVFREEAMSGDYDHLLQTCMKYAEVG